MTNRYRRLGGKERTNTDISSFYFVIQDMCKKPTFISKQVYLENLLTLPAHKAQTYHCVSFVLQSFGLLYVILHRMLSELGARERRERQNKKIE